MSNFLDKCTNTMPRKKNILQHYFSLLDDPERDRFTDLLKIKSRMTRGKYLEDPATNIPLPKLEEIRDFLNNQFDIELDVRDLSRPVSDLILNGEN